jgi:tetratricopeptide (TPR) repeat protein
VALSTSNLTGAIPLASRFIGPILVTLFNEPDKLDQPLPKLWQQQAKALYLPNFIQTEATRDLYLEMESTHPADPAIKYGLYQALRETKQPILAMQALEQAVVLDPVYGLEYLQLAPFALEKHRPDEALHMMNLAVEAFPDNPFISLEKVRTLLTMGEHQQPIALLKKLKALTWSEFYYPQMPEQIQAMLEVAQEEATQKKPSAEPAS